MAHIDETAVTSNQATKRQFITDATLEVLARDGLAGCTERAIAAVGPLTKSAVHYYFRDTDELIDRAMAEHLEDMTEDLWQAADKHDDPRARLLAVVDTALRIFVGPTRAARGRNPAQREYAEFLWFEYWISLTRRAKTERMQRSLRQLHALFGELLADKTTGSALCTWLLGTVIQQSITPRPVAELQAEALSYLDRSAG